ncbi:zinc finger CCCH domain-containing protein 24 [Impatiens glandulifera]|uniref:zinc finger CCCH domain-containing protein 24 n=1 Tax=Impatiens glandulifera TaxID=253017 RepID=UPI001FB0A843|nr:zinc finger CCCH domain-containing protein 24 [Impatiens glandulifera]
MNDNDSIQSPPLPTEQLKLMIPDDSTQSPAPPAEELKQMNGNDSTQSPADAQSPVKADAELGEKRKREDEPVTTEEKLPTSRHPLWKTSMCSYFRGHGVCKHGDSCRFAHSEEELLLRPDNTWDPTSERAKKMKTDDSEKLDSGEDPNPTEDGFLMTDAFDDDSSEPALSKCLVHLPMKWTSDNLKSFLSDQGIAYKSAKKKKNMAVGFVNFDDVDQVKQAMKELEGKCAGNKTLKIADVVPRTFEKKARPTMSVQSSSDHTEMIDSSNGCQNGDNVEETTVGDGSDVKARSARDSVTPLGHMQYIDQLEYKKNNLMQMLKKLTKNARRACPNGVPLPQWIRNSREIGGLPCNLEGIIESPLVEGYRNKCEFSVGYSQQGKPTVGFMIGNFREGVTAVEEPTDCLNVSSIACKFASIFQEFLQTSELPLWNRFNNSGFWRQLTVREGRKLGSTSDMSLEDSIAQVMLIIQVSTKGFDDGVISVEFEKMAEAFSTGASVTSPALPLTALVVQDHQGISNVSPTDAPLRTLVIRKPGSEAEPANNDEEARIHDYIGNLQFSISPTAFFQVNTLAAEKLYSLAGDWAGLGPDTLLFDICCGTGTIGLTLAHRVGMVVGIEMNEFAVSDAIRNSEINGIKNCRFVCAKAENIIGSLLKEYIYLPEKNGEVVDSQGSNIEEAVDVKEHSTSEEVSNPKDTLEGAENGTSVRQFKNVVAIVDPPRGGLHPTVIKVLRTHSQLKRLVYISCNPESLVANAIELCTPSSEMNDKSNKDNRGWRKMSSAGLARHRTKSMPNSEPFQPVKATAVDLFPHTPHCELVMLLER